MALKMKGVKIPKMDSEPREARSGTGAPMHISTKHHPQASISHMETPPPEFSQFNLSRSSPNLLFSFSLIPNLEGGQKIVFNFSLSSSTKSKPAMTILSPYKLTDVFFFMSYTWNKWIYFHQIWKIYVVWPELKWVTAYFNVYESILLIYKYTNKGEKKSLPNNRKPKYIHEQWQNKEIAV